MYKVCKLFWQNEDCCSVGILHRVEEENGIGARKWRTEFVNKNCHINKQFLSIFQIGGAGDPKHFDKWCLPSVG